MFAQSETSSPYSPQCKLKLAEYVNEVIVKNNLVGELIRKESNENRRWTHLSNPTFVADDFKGSFEFEVTGELISIERQWRFVDASRGIARYSAGLVIGRPKVEEYGCYAWETCENIYYPVCRAYVDVDAASEGCQISELKSSSVTCSIEDGLLDSVSNIEEYKE